MKRSEVRRLSSFLYANGYEKYDYYHNVVEHGFKIVSRGGLYIAVKEVEGVRFVRSHEDLYSLVRIVFGEIFNWNASVFQKQLIRECDMSTPLSEAVIERLRELNVQTKSVAGFRHNRPQPLSLRPPIAPEVDEAIKAACIPRELFGEIDLYHHSSEESDMGLRARGFTVLCEKPLVEAEFDTFFEMFVRAAVNMPDVDLLRDSEPITAATMMSQQQTHASAGLLNLNTMYGSAVGSKKEMHASAAAVNISACLNPLKTPGVLPGKVVPKNEVIKKGKKVREIIVESQANFMVLKHFFEDQVTGNRDLPSGRAIGMSTLHGNFKIIPMSWFDVYLRHRGRVSWNDFLLWLSEQTINESDKTAWESSTNEVDGLVYVICRLIECNPPSDAFSRSLLARALADYICPAVQIDSDKVYFAPWRIASGSYLTADGNTARHRSMNDWVCDYIETHGGYGKEGCVCSVCDKFGVGPRVDAMHIEFMRRGFIMGDDYLAICEHPQLFNDIMDFKFKTTTKTEPKRFFSLPSLEEPDGCEFLKKHFWLDRTGEAWNVRTFRAPGRLLAKLIRGEATSRPGRFHAAALSALWETGANEPLYNIVRRIMENVVTEQTAAELDKHLGRYVKRSPALHECSPMYIPTFSDVLNSDGSLMRPLKTVYWSRRCEEIGVRPAWFGE